MAAAGCTERSDLVYSTPGRATAAAAQDTAQLQCVAARLSATMALHTNVGLGDFILMEKINMDEFVKNLRVR